MSNPPFKRRNYFVKKNFQGKLILGYFLFMVGGCLLFTIILAAMSADTLTVVYKNNELQLGQTPLMLIRQVLTAHWFFVVIGGAIVIVAAMLITHRTAGPMYRFERTVTNMVQGKLDDVIYLREKDEGKEIAELLNQFNRELSGKMTQIHDCTHNIDVLLSRCVDVDSTFTLRPEVSALFASLKEQNAKIREISSTYKKVDA